MSFVKAFQEAGGLADSSSKTAKTGTLTLLRGESKSDFEAGGEMLKMYEHFIDAAKLIENVLPVKRRISKQVTSDFSKTLK